MPVTNLALARNMRTAGVECTATISSARAPVRVRNAARRMLATGELTGSWSSKSKRMASAYMGHFKLPKVCNSWSLWVVTQGARMPEALAVEIRSLLDANLMLSLAGTSNGTLMDRRYREWHTLQTQALHGYAKNGGKTLAMPHLVTEIQVQIGALCAEWLTELPETQQRRADMLAAFDSGEVIPFDLEQSYD
jgi:hypothetical protein